MRNLEGLTLWNAVEDVDPKYTKRIEGREFSGDTVNLTYTTRKLTEVLGPAGDRWGWEVIDERVHEYGSHENKDFTAIHAVRVRLWFRREDGTTGHIEDYGTTKLAYWAKPRSGPPYLKVDEEACKKSLSDAKSKLFVALGGSAQVWLGEFDRTQHKNIGRERAESHDPETGEVMTAAPRGDPEPASDDRGRRTYSLNGNRHTADEWIVEADRVARGMDPGKLGGFLAGTKATRNEIYKHEADARKRLMALSEDIKARALGAVAGEGSPQ